MSDSTIETNLENLSKDELIKELRFLKGERNKRLKSDISLSQAHKLLEHENERIIAIQEFIGEALKLTREEDVYELTIETIIESYQCENALFLSHISANQWEIIYDFSDSFDIKILEINTSKTLSGYLIDDQNIFLNCNALQDVNGMISFYQSGKNKLAIIAYNSLESLGTFEKITETFLPSFEIISNQIGTVLKNIYSTKILKEFSNSLEVEVKQRTKELQKSKLIIEEIHKQTRESIEYASLIQSALIPDNKIFHKFFTDSFAIWHPKDIVGGDIYLVEELSNDEIIIMVIDCTGHGVPGAFVTMLVKAIERQIIAKIHKDKMVSPAKILSIFNKSIKRFLNQESIDSISNAGFDGGVLYYNKKEKILRFSGAETPLFIIQKGEIMIIKGNRHSIGYKKSDANYEFTDHTIEVNQTTKIYLTTDGYLDQNGGVKGFPFGKKRFTNLILENTSETFADQQEILLYELQNYQQKEERNDDVTIIGVQF